MMIRILLAYLCLTGAAMAQTISVPAGSDLTTIVRGLDGGETLLLAPGIYPAARIKQARFVEPVTLRSADPNTRAVLKGLRVDASANLIFDRLHFKYDFEPGQTVRAPRPFHFSNSDQITITNSIFEGAIAQEGDPTIRGYAVAKGLAMHGGKQIKIDGNTFFKWFAAAQLHTLDRVQFTNNDIHSIRSDGLNCSELYSAFIAYNHFHDFAVSPQSKDHQDMIQCWSARTTRAMDGLTIQGNLLNSGKGRWTQSIFLRNEVVDKGERGRNFYYRNVTIKDNVVINAHQNAIYVGHADGVVVENNTVVRTQVGAGPRDNPNLYTPALSVNAAAENVVIRGNIVNRIMGYDGQSGWQVSANQLVQDRYRLKPNYYAQIFAQPPGNTVANMNDFRLRADGPLAGVAIGAPNLRN